MRSWEIIAEEVRSASRTNSWPLQGPCFGMRVLRESTDRGCDPISLEREYSQGSEKYKCENLSDFEWGFGECRRESVQCWNFFKGLCDKSHEIEVERQHGRNDIGAAPAAGQLQKIKRQPR